MIIGLTGYKFSGKDETANFIISKTKDTLRFHKYSFAGPLKKTVGEMFGWNDDDLNDPNLKEKTDEFWGVSPREILQWMGTDIARIALPNRFPELKKLHGENFWIKTFIRWYKNQSNKNVIISDVRFTNEAQLIKSEGGILIRVHRDSVVPSTINHPSENVELLQPLVDINVSNNGTIEDLWENTNLVINYIHRQHGETQ